MEVHENMQVATDHVKKRENKVYLQGKSIACKFKGQNIFGYSQSIPRQK